MKKKRWVALGLSMALAGSLFSGCGGNNSAGSNNGNATTSVAEEIQDTESTPTTKESYPELYNVDESKVSEGGTITIAVMHSWTKLNLWDAEDDLVANMVNDKIWDKLVYANNEDSTIEPRAAKSWEVSDDKLTWTFHLDENCTFSDGEKVTANDWVWTFQTMSDSEVVCIMKSYLSVLDGTDDAGNEVSENSIAVSAQDDYTLVMKFKKPMFEDTFAYYYNAKYCVLPEHLLKDIPMSELLANEFWEKPVGSGPLAIEEEVAGSTITMKVRKDYQLGNTNADTVVYKVLDYTNYVPSLISGDVDLHQGYISYEDAMDAENQEAYSAYKARYADVANIMFLNNSTISDKRIRQAMNLCIDKEAYVQVREKGQGVTAETYVIPGSKYFDSSLTYQKNIEEAKKLVEEAGWDTNKVLKWATYGADDGQLLVQQNLAEIGIQVEFETMDIPSIFAGIIEGKYDISSLPFQAYMEPFWTDTIINSYSSISDETKAKLNELKEKIEWELDDEARVKLLYEYQEYLHDEMIFIPICHSYVYKGINDKLKNVDFNSDLTAVWKWIKED